MKYGDLLGKMASDEPLTETEKRELIAKSNNIDSLSGASASIFLPGTSEVNLSDILVRSAIFQRQPLRSSFFWNASQSLTNGNAATIQWNSASRWDGQSLVVPYDASAYELQISADRPEIVVIPVTVSWKYTSGGTFTDMQIDLLFYQKSDDTLILTHQLAYSTDKSGSVTYPFIVQNGVDHYGTGFNGNWNDHYFVVKATATVSASTAFRWAYSFWSGW